MTGDANDRFTQVMQRLDRLAGLNETDREAVRSLPFKISAVPGNHVLIREGEEVTDCCIVLDGYACRHKESKPGSRQIVSFHMPGDILGIRHLLLARADHNLETITPVDLAWIPAADLRRIAKDRPAVNEALWRELLVEASIFREWVLNVGRRDPKERVAHMLCEFAARHEAAGLGLPGRLPMTPQQIGDAAGLPLVLVHRILFELMQEAIIAPDERCVEVKNWPGLRQIAKFDPSYLSSAA